MHLLLLSLCALDCFCLFGVAQRTISLQIGLALHACLILLSTHYLVTQAKKSVAQEALTSPVMNYLSWGSLLLFLPVIGGLIGWVFLGKNRWFRPPVLKNAAETAPAKYLKIGTERTTVFTNGRAEQRMSALTTEDYLDLLSATRQLQGKPTVALLKDAMNSKTESVRLLAHALYSKQEQQLAQQLSALVARFKQGQMRNPQLHLAFAQLYWHWLELDTLDEQDRQDVMSKVRLHAEFARLLNPRLAQAHWLAAQTYLQAQDYLAATHAFQTALANGCRAERVTPYLEEIVFRQNRPATADRIKEIA